MLQIFLHLQRWVFPALELKRKRGDEDTVMAEPAS
jgi:hypothetical protein